MPNFIDLTGQRFGRWTVISRADDHFTKSGIRVTMWNCVCDCGTHKTVMGNSLRKGTTQSCGCYSQEVKSKLLIERNKRNAKHGLSRDRLYPVWRAMIRRCNNPNDDFYYVYGERGIKMCEEWEKSYPAFKEWALSNGWQEGLSIDRIDNDKGYSPDNCRWATAKVQSNNRRSNHLITGFGMTKNISQWAETLNIPYDKLYYRLSMREWSIEKAVMET